MRSGNLREWKTLSRYEIENFRIRFFEEEGRWWCCGRGAKIDEIEKILGPGKFISKFIFASQSLQLREKLNDLLRRVS